MSGNSLAGMILEPRGVKRYDRDLSENEINNLADKWVKEPGWFEFDRGDFINFCRALIHAHEKKRGGVVFTKKQNGELLMVSRQDEEGQILRVLWESGKSKGPSLLDRIRGNYDYE